MLRVRMMPCCFCATEVSGPDYIELGLRIDRSPASQYLGAHRKCLTERLARGFRIELDPLTKEELDRLEERGSGAGS